MLMSLRVGNDSKALCNSHGIVRQAHYDNIVMVSLSNPYSTIVSFDMLRITVFT